MEFCLRLFTTMVRAPVDITDTEGERFASEVERIYNEAMLKFEVELKKLDPRLLVVTRA